MGDKDSSHFEDFEEEEEDALSLCDLAMNDNGVSESNDPSYQYSPITSTDQDLFHFFSDLSSAIRSPSEDIVFCGKIISHDHHRLNHYQRSIDGDLFAGENSSNSLRFPNSDLHRNRRPPVRRDSSSVPTKVNITSVTSMSAKSKLRMFMFGPVKFKPEMDLSEIKKRQSRRAPAQMSPAACETVRGGGKKGGWGLMRTLISGPHLPASLVRSFACISMPRVLETTA